MIKEELFKSIWFIDFVSYTIHRKFEFRFVERLVHHIKLLLHLISTQFD